MSIRIKNVNLTLMSILNENIKLYHSYIRIFKSDVMHNMALSISILCTGNYNSIPRNSELLAAQDVNCNIGIRSKMFRDVIGPYGINNRNAKGKDPLFLLKSIKFRVLLIYYRQ